jgi:hypothetical protein
LYFFLTKVKAAGIVVLAIINKSKDSVASSVKARAAGIVLTPVILLVVVKVGVAMGIIALHKVLDLVELIQSVVSVF